MRKVLVIRFSALGDVAMLVPIVRAAAEQNPETEFTVISRQQTEALWSGLPANVVFFGVDIKGRHNGIKGLRKLLNEVDYRAFDAVADMHSVLRSWYMDIMCILAGLKVRRIDKGRIEKWWLTCRFNHHKRRLKRTVFRYRDVFVSLGMKVDIDEPRFENSSGGVGIAPFAAQKGKIFPIDEMEKLAAEIAKNEKVYLFGGGKKEIEVLERWEAKHCNMTCVAGRHTMAEELEIMRSLRVMITMDSGNMHLASLVGTRVISIWGATHPYAGFLGWGQAEEDCWQRNDLRCRPCSIYGNKECRYGDYRCLNFSIRHDCNQL